MADEQLELIRQYCDTDGMRLSSSKKDLLCKILESPGYYDGYTSPVYEDSDEGRTHDGRWSNRERTQYRINIGSSLSIDMRYHFQCDDGYERGSWDWSDATHITDLRDILDCLEKMEYDL